MRIERVERLTKAYVELTAAIAATRLSNKRTSGYATVSAAEKAAENIAEAITDEVGPITVAVKTPSLSGGV